MRITLKVFKLSFTTKCLAIKLLLVDLWQSTLNGERKNCINTYFVNTITRFDRQRAPLAVPEYTLALQIQRIDSEGMKSPMSCITSAAGFDVL